MVGDKALFTQSAHKALEDANMGEAIGSVARDENVDVARVRLATTVATHDLDPELGLNGERGSTDFVEDLAALFARDALDKLIIQVKTNLGLAARENSQLTFWPSVRPKSLVLRSSRVRAPRSTRRYACLGPMP